MKIGIGIHAWSFSSQELEVHQVVGRKREAPPPPKKKGGEKISKYNIIIVIKPEYEEECGRKPEAGHMSNQRTKHLFSE